MLQPIVTPIKHNTLLCSPQLHLHYLRLLAITILANLILSFVSLGQVINDNIENRRRIAAEEIIKSSTVGCTVQWGCVDEKLTGKCIEYHNDQWFEFQPLASGTYYVNIGHQKCRDIRGVQLVAMLGTPCQPDSYRILACASLGTQDDLFIPLVNLQANQRVLLNIDGYLKDFCDFTIQVSHRARGLPVYSITEPPGGLPAVSRIVKLTWQVPDSLTSVQQCRVLRREQHAFRNQEVGIIPLVSSTLGMHQNDYALIDTLPGTGNYSYQIIVESSDDTPPLMLRQQWISYSQLRPIWPGQIGAGMSYLDLPLTRYPRGAYLVISIARADTKALLRRFVLTNNPNQPRQGRVYAQPWLEAGIQRVEVSIDCHPINGPATHDLIEFPVVIPTY